MRYHTIEVDGKEYNFRLNADEIESIEKNLKVKILDYIQDYSVITIIYLLQRMWKHEDKHKTSHEEAIELFDELVDNGYAIESIAKQIIWPTCVVSGLLTQSDLNKALNRAEEQATQN